MTETNPEYSLGRLKELAAALDPVAHLLENRLCVYATGSYGRLEAGFASDIDLFFLDDAADPTQPFPFTQFILVSARLIEATKQMGFPRFSGDGRYLEVQPVSQMEKVLGSPDDDSVNAFTARMLLLLESRPLRDEALYEKLLRRIIGFYYRDFQDHRDDFVPVFLVNDILRFWRTLTLNYEHHRLKLGTLTGDELATKKADSALKNYKLKMSRLSTCFSMVAHLSSASVPVRSDAVYRLCRLTPQERLSALSNHSDESRELVAELQERYGRFLKRVQGDPERVLVYFAADKNRRLALDEAAAYGATFFKLLEAITPPERFRFLVI